MQVQYTSQVAVTNVIELLFIELSKKGNWKRLGMSNGLWLNFIFAYNAEKSGGDSRADKAPTSCTLLPLGEGLGKRGAATRSSTFAPFPQRSPKGRGS